MIRTTISGLLAYVSRLVSGTLGALAGVSVGLVVGFAIAWFVLLSPMKASVEARERAVQQWEALVAKERQAVGEIKHLSVEELRKWTAAVTEQNTRFADVQRQLHRQEIELTGPGTAFVAIAGFAVLAGLGFAAGMAVDGNREAATTLDNIAALAPAQMVTVSQVAAAERRKGAVADRQDREIAALPRRRQNELEGPQESPADAGGNASLVACPYCSSRVRQDRLQNHVRKTHPGRSNMAG